MAPIKAGLLDEWVAYVAPMAVGDDARGLFSRPALTSLDDAARFSLSDVRQLGGDLRLTLLRA
jgi:diaminohydroxyphosphoribosylaminopyrimidine deaminase/5-amino-6-(5-phosphoribosylamino)uracil reductase